MPPAPAMTPMLVTMYPSEVARYPEPRDTAGCCCVTTLTTAGLARAAACTMAESSVRVTPERRLTCWGLLVRDCTWSTARVTPAATRAVTSRPAATIRIGLTPLILGTNRYRGWRGSFGYQVMTSWRFVSKPAERYRRTAESLSG